MARIPDSELEHLKATVSLQRLVEAKGVTLTRHGADLNGRCPFHADRTPSLATPARRLNRCAVQAERGSWRGGSGAKGRSQRLRRRP